MARAFTTIRTTFARISAAIARHCERMREEKVRRARFEAEMYQGRYYHSSKNDDDLPIWPRAWAASAHPASADEPKT